MEEWRRKKIENVYAKWDKRTSHPDRTKPTLNGHTTAYKPNRALVIRSSRYSNGRNNTWRRNKDSQLPVAATFLPSLGVASGELQTAHNLKYMSIRYCCPRCLPASKIQFSPDDSATMPGLLNFLCIDNRKYGVIGKLFPSTVHAWSTVADYSMGDLRKDSLQSKRVQDAIVTCAEAASEKESVEYAVALREQKARASDIIGGMSSAVYTSLARMVAWAMLCVSRRLFNRIQVSRKHMGMIYAAQKQGVPIVFLPGHKSHMDYIIMSFLLFLMGIHIPRIAAGDNLRIPLISWLVTHLGGFFIKRKLDTAAGKDVLYRKCLQEFMEKSLCEGENMEFFIEGSRSRSGKPNSPKAGLLSVLVDAVKEGVVKDIFLVPVGISYDMLLERNFVRHELMGGSKRPETFWKAMRGVWIMLTRNTGSIRVDFAQPFSLQEYLSSSSIADHSQLELTNATQYTSILNMADVAQRKVVTALSQHIVHDITHCAALMSTSMVAFLLLTKHREGVSVTDLVASYLWLEETASKKQRSVGFAGDASEAVHYALHYLKPLLTFDPHLRRISCDQEVFPRLELPDVFQLLHHANQVTPMLVLEAVIACSLQCLIGGGGTKLSHCGRDGRGDVELGKDELLDSATFLCKILSREFIFAPPCLDVWSVLADTVDSMVNSDLLRIPSELDIGDLAPGKKQPYLFFGDSDDEEEENCSSIRLQINTEPWALEHLQFLQSILDPFLEGYWNTAVALLQMESTMEETEFLKQLQETLVHKVEKGILRNVESCSMDTLRNAVKSLVDLGYLSHRQHTQLCVVDVGKMMALVERMTDFKSQ